MQSKVKGSSLVADYTVRLRGNLETLALRLAKDKPPGSMHISVFHHTNTIIHKISVLRSNLERKHFDNITSYPAQDFNRRFSSLTFSPSSGAPNSVPLGDWRHSHSITFN